LLWSGVSGTSDEVGHRIVSTDLRAFQMFAVRPQVGKKYPPAGASHDAALNSNNNAVGIGRPALQPASDLFTG
jgi:hypothetical protein